MTATTTPAFDPVALASSLASAAEKSAKAIGDFAGRQANSGTPAFSDELGIGKAFMELAANMLSNPAKLAESQMNLWWEYMSLWQGSMLRMMGTPTEPVMVPAKSDKRFKHEDWQEHFLFDYIKQSYLITARWMHDQVATVEGLDDQTKKKVDFFTRQYIDALAPSNFALTNPEVFRETVASGGQNLVKGLNNLLDDIERGGGQLKISMTDSKAFELGVNIATTPGKVVFQTELMQLIQYEPTTKKAWKRPLLVIPPWINKYYILDLREKNSMLRWAANEGMTVFIISWVNPDAKLAHKNFEDYLTEGTLAALDAIEKATGEEEVNTVGYCLGGTLLAATMGYLAAHKQKRIASATFMASLLDFTSAGELEVFIDEAQVSALEKKMNERGFLEGSEMATTFNMLRANTSSGRSSSTTTCSGAIRSRSTSCTGTAIPRGCRRPCTAITCATCTCTTCCACRAGSNSPARRSICRRSTRQRISCRPSRTTSHRGRPPTPGRRSCRASRASCCRGRAISPAWSTRLPPTSTASGPTTSCRRRRTAGSRGPNSTTVRGGPIGGNGSSPTSGARYPRGCPARASSKCWKRRRAATRAPAWTASSRYFGAGLSTSTLSGRGRSERCGLAPAGAAAAGAAGTGAACGTATGAGAGRATCGDGIDTGACRFTGGNDGLAATGGGGT